MPALRPLLHGVPQEEKGLAENALPIKLGSEPYQSKILFEQIFLEKKCAIGELHHQMIK